MIELLSGWESVVFATDSVTFPFVAAVILVALCGAASQKKKRNLQVPLFNGITQIIKLETQYTVALCHISLVRNLGPGTDFLSHLCKTFMDAVR